MRKAKEQYTVQLEPEFVAQLDKLAAKIGLTRSQLMRNLLHVAYDDVIVLDKIGLIAAFQMGQKLIRQIKVGIASGKISFDDEGNLKIKE